MNDVVPTWFHILSSSAIASAVEEMENLEAEDITLKFLLYHVFLIQDHSESAK